MTLQELRDRQSWPLDQKVDHAIGTIEAFISRVGGLDKVYVSFSGGKDSTVLFHLARRIYPDILGVFCNTGNENPSAIKFVKGAKSKGANIQIIRPAMTPRQVWAKYGFPLISKDSSRKISDVRRNPNSNTAKRRLTSTKFAIAKRWLYLIEEPYNTSDKCCEALKKRPFRAFEKQTGRYPILGVRADESQLREKDYIRHGGCNQFGDMGRYKSLPLSIWLDKDIDAYIKRYEVALADIYYKGFLRTGCMGCGFGAQISGDPRFALLYREYPKCYDMVMNYTNNGVTFREALRKVLAANGLYLPDEAPANLFEN